jgi:hypothetical protein
MFSYVPVAIIIIFSYVPVFSYFFHMFLSLLLLFHLFLPYFFICSCRFDFFSAYGNVVYFFICFCRHYYYFPCVPVVFFPICSCRLFFLCSCLLFFHMFLLSLFS